MKFQKLRRIFSAVLSAAIVLTPNCCHATLYRYRMNSGISNPKCAFGVTEYFYTTNDSVDCVNEILKERVDKKWYRPYESSRSYFSSGKFVSNDPVQVWIFDYEKFGNGLSPAKWNLISVTCDPLRDNDLMCVPTPAYFKDKPDLMERFRNVLLGDKPHAMAKKLEGDLPPTLAAVFLPEAHDANGATNPQYFDLNYDFAAPTTRHAYMDCYRYGPAEDWYEDRGFDPELWDASVEKCIYTIRNLHCYLRACRIKQAG